jgi:hypothetical protein
MAVALWTTTGALSKVTVRLRRAGKVVEAVRLARVGTHHRRVILRVKGTTPKPGRYTVLAAHHGKTLARHAFRLR